MPGDVYWYKGSKQGFEPGEKIPEAEASDDIRAATAPTFVDLNRDGKLDMVVGNIHGDVRYALNVGTRTKPKMSKRVLLFTKFTTLRVNGDSAPLAVDWDRDGQIDLLVGTGDGKVMFYRGSRKAGSPIPAFANGVALKAAGREINVGNRSKLCATDWNGDGKLDLLVGNYGYKGTDDYGNVYLFLRI